MKYAIALFILLLAAPAWAQLGYSVPSAAPTATMKTPDMKTQDLPVNVKKTRTNQPSIRPDWYALFLLWAKANPSDVLRGLSAPPAFDNFAQFLACDWVRDFRQNDVAWPQRRTQIIQSFNERVKAPQSRFTLLARGTVGAYAPDAQAFEFRPLAGAAFPVTFNKTVQYGMEDDCPGNERIFPQPPWPNAFMIEFQNPDFIAALPMAAARAESFVSSFPKNDKGEYDRRVVLEIVFDVTAIEPPAAKPGGGDAQGVGVKATALAASVWRDTSMTQELARYGGAAPAAAR